jgi:hypothetical protein
VGGSCGREGSETSAQPETVGYARERGNVKPAVTLRFSAGVVVRIARHQTWREEVHRLKSAMRLLALSL